MTEVRLTGGRSSHGVARSGDTVVRPTGPWTPTIHEFLRHLEARGFEGAPRVLGMDEQGREVLTYIDGEVASDCAWRRGHATRLPDGALSDENLATVARMIRALHDASADFAPTQQIWRDNAYPLQPGEIACHCDLGAHNTVYRDGVPVAFIDWDGARPNEALLDLAFAAWCHVPLADDAYCAEMGFPEPPDRARRLRVFAQAYGVGVDDLLDAARRSKIREGERPRYWPIDTAWASAFFGHLQRELAWLGANERDLR